MSTLIERAQDSTCINITTDPRRETMGIHDLRRIIYFKYAVNLAVKYMGNDGADFVRCIEALIHEY